MRPPVQLKSVFVFSLLVAPLCAQDSTSPQPDEWLHKFVGQWEVSHGDSEAGEASMAPTGTIEGKMLGERWVVNETVAEGGGMKVHAIQVLGFDEQKKKYVGTWMDSSSDYIWHYEGTLDEKTSTLSLEAEGPNFMDGDGLANFRDSYQFKSADHIVASTAIQMKDGSWKTIMTADVRRKK